ncbi:MAG: LPS export ABC transporter periplasmic protein LptC, partial [Proteobacteria bacterium]|nr:LPS export ABC transporter periplasmic protein LptC [Pseudomonadota bacterium]
VFLGVVFVQQTQAPVPTPNKEEKAEAQKPGLDELSQPLNAEKADIVAEDIELVQGADGRIDWKIRARIARYSQEKNVVSIVRPELFAYIGESRDEVFVRAETGEVDQEADNFSLRENVVGRYGLFALKADEMDYIGALDKIYLKGRVIVQRPDVDIRAKAIEIDVINREMLAAGGVTATLSPGAMDDGQFERLGLTGKE